MRVFEMFDDAAIAISDFSRTRIQNDLWLFFYNKAVRDVSSRLPIYQKLSYFTLFALAGEYVWPENMVQCQGIQVSLTPSNDTGWQSLGEMPEDRWRQATWNRYPDQELPTHYSPRSNRFWLFPMASAQLDLAALMTYTALPAKVADPYAEDFPLPVFARDYVSERMAMLAHRKLNEYAEADKMEEDWLRREPDMRERLEDRTDDARPRIRASERSSFTSRHV